MANPRYYKCEVISYYLAPPFRGAKSSQRFRAAICLRRPFPRRDLLPAPCKALLLRSGEQNLHRNSAPPSASGGIFAARFAPRSPQSLAAPFRGAKSSHNSRGSIAGGPRRPSKNPRSTFCFGDFSFTFIFLYLSISSRWDSGFRK